MAEPAPGSVVAGCRVEEVIGRGGMGVVYRATQESLRRTVALKLIAPELTTNPAFRERFKRESLLAASIEHPNVIPVYDAGEVDALLYLVIRYIEGTDLKALLRSEGPLEPRRAARIVTQVASALAAAHRRGLIHRDVKPANVLIERAAESEHAYLTDFGIARDIGSNTALTKTGVLVGTLDYIAPERLEDAPADGRSDIYALGCVLFETLTGRVPFPYDSDMAKMYAHTREPVPSVRELRPEVPEALAAATARAMAKDPGERFATADELAAVLGGGADSQPEPAAPGQAETPTRIVPTPTAPPIAPAAPPPAAPGPPSASTERLAPGRRRFGPIMAAVTALAAVALIAVLLLSGGGSEKKGGGGRAISLRALAPIDVGRGADGVTAGAGSVWVANNVRGTLVRVAPRSRRVVGNTPVGSNPDSVAVAGGTVWVTNTNDDDVSRVDARSGGPLGTVAVGDAPEGIVASRDAVWVANGRGGSVSRIDPHSGQARTAQLGRAPVQLALYRGTPWVTVSGEGTVVELDPATGRPAATVRVGGSPRGVAYAAGRLWVSLSDSDEVVAIDPASRREVARVGVPANPREVQAGKGFVWVTCAGAGTVVAIDTSSRKVAAQVRVKGSPFGLAVGEGKVWAASLDAGLLTPIEPR